jgi:hypothetical protein
MDIVKRRVKHVWARKISPLVYSIIKTLNTHSIFFKRGQKVSGLYFLKIKPTTITYLDR